MLVGGYVSLIFLVVILFAASIIDTKQNRIPNALNALTAAYGVGAHLYTGSGVLPPLAGMAIGLVVFLPFYIGGGMGAGDVKLMSAIGAILGISVVMAAGLSLIAGSFMGLFILLKQPNGREALRNFSQTLYRLFRWGTWEYEKPPGYVTGRQFPYAMAIAAGTLITVMFIIPTG